MAEVGTVYVTVMPNVKGFSNALSGKAGLAGTSSGKAFNLSFGKIVGASALGNIVSSAFSKVTGAITSSMDSAISRVDTLNNFPKVMQNLGYGADEAAVSIDTLATGIDGMPTSLDGIVSMTQQLAPLCGGLDKATELSLAMNNMFLASGASTADQARAMQQYTQMLARGKVELNDWRTLQEVMPGQLNQVAQAMLGAGKNSSDLYEALKNGEVTMNDFNDTVKTLNKEGVGEFASFEQQARSATEGIGTAMENVRNRIAKAVGSVIDHIGQGNISGIINGFSSQFGNMATVVCQAWDGMMKTLRVDHIKVVFDQLGATLTGVFGQADMADSFGKAVGNVLNGIIPVVKSLTPVIEGMGRAFLYAADFIYEAWMNMMMTIDFGRLKSVFEEITGAIGDVLTKGDEASTFGSQMGDVFNYLISVLHNLVPYIQFFASALKLVIDNAGWLLPTVIVLVAAFKGFKLLNGLTGIFNGFSGTLAKATPTMAASASQMLGLAAAAAGIGIGIALACAGVALLVMSAIQLAEAGPMAALALVGLVAIVFGFGAALYFAAPALDAAALGMIAFGAAVLMVGAGVLLVCAGLTMLSGALPMISAYGLSAAGAIAALGGGMLMAAPGAFLLGAALFVCGGGAIFAGVGLAAVAIAAMAAFAGLLLCSGPAALLGPALVQSGVGALVLGAALMVVAVSSLAAAPGLLALAACIGGVGLALLAAVPAFIGLSGALGGIVGPLESSASAMSTIVGACKQANSGAAVASVSFKAMGASMTAAAAMMQAAGNRISAAQSDLAFRIQAAASRIQASFNNMRLHIPSPTLGKMPHFSLRGSFDLQAGTVPTIDVNWYANGGVFNRASIIGVGEAGRELVTPEQVMQRYLDKAANGNYDSQMLAQMVELLSMILNAIPSLTDRDLQRMIRRTANA